MNARQALGRGGFAAAACVACCAPPIIAALGVTAGLAATAGIFLGLAAAIAVVLAGAAWIAGRTRRPNPQPNREPADEVARVPAPIRRDHPSTDGQAGGQASHGQSVAVDNLSR